MSYLVQASGALRIYTLVDLKALEDERKKFDKRKIHGLLQEKNIVYENHQKKVSFSNLHAKNLILYLAFADFEEQQMKTESAHEIYKKFLAQEGVDPTLVSLWNQILQIHQMS